MDSQARVLLMAFRQGLLLILSAIEVYLGIKPEKRRVIVQEKEPPSENS